MSEYCSKMAPTPWTYEGHELTEGYSAIIYDARGRCVLDHCNEPFARLIVAAVNAYREPTEADVERVARAMFEGDEIDRAKAWGARMTWNVVGKVYQDRWRDRAKAAIAAMQGGRK